MSGQRRAPGPALKRDHGYRSKTFARYLRLCARTAGEIDEIDLEDAIGTASFQVATGRIPPAGAWVEGLIQARQRDSMGAFF